MMKLITILKVSSESGIWICNFLNPLFRVEVFNTLLIRNCVDPKSGYFLSSDITRSSPVLYCEYCSQNGNLVPRFSHCRARGNFPRFTTHALLPTFLEKSWVLKWIRVNPDTCRIRVDGQIRFQYGYVWTWKFLNPERKRCGFKNIRTCVERVLF